MCADRKNPPMAETLACYCCGVDRLPRDVAPVVPGYEIRSFECPECRTVLRQVFACYAGPPAVG